MTDLYSEILEFDKMNFDKMNLDTGKLIEDYATDLVEGMDVETLVQFAYDVIVENLEDMSVNEILEQVEVNAPHLLEELDVVVPDVEPAQ
jgi:hypothetical protein